MSFNSGLFLIAAAMLSLSISLILLFVVSELSILHNFGNCKCQKAIFSSLYSALLAFFTVCDNAKRKNFFLSLPPLSTLLCHCNGNDCCSRQLINVTKKEYLWDFDFFFEVYVTQTICGLHVTTSFNISLFIFFLFSDVCSSNEKL